MLSKRGKGEGKSKSKKQVPWGMGLIGTSPVRVAKSMFSPKPHSLEGNTANNFHVFATNARLQTDTKLAELLGELETLEWDALLFSETRTAIGKRILPGGHMLLGSTTATNSSVLRFYYVNVTGTHFQMFNVFRTSSCPSI